jgi:hypothetical protein
MSPKMKAAKNSFTKLTVWGVLAVLLFATNYAVEAQSAGETVVLAHSNISLVNDTPVCMVLADEAARAAFTKADVADDIEGVHELVQAGRAFAVPVGTKARLLAGGFATVEVRILDGEYAGRRGFVPTAMIETAK